MKKIAIITATRAEYGILIPLIRAVDTDSELDLQLLVTGTHLSEKYGMTVKFIEEDGLRITEKLPILSDGNTPYDVSITMANAICQFAEYFRKDRPDMVVILGDRTEMLGAASAAMNERIPIAHIHGGEVTEGAVDDCIRHALSKMSYIHFTTTEEYRRRVIQLGEEPSRVFNAGSLGTENILKTRFLKEQEIRDYIGISEHIPYAVATFHPVTLESNSVTEQVEELCAAMTQRADVFFLITMSNADAGGDRANSILGKYAASHSNARLISNLGMVRYLSAVKYAAFMIGNSSSGVIEAPVLGTPTINIGDRQKGRIMAKSVINCEAKSDKILQAINIAEKMEHIPSLLFGDGSTSKRMLKIIKGVLQSDKINLKKGFFDWKEDI